MILKWIFDRFVSFIGLVVLSPVLFIFAILIRTKTETGKIFFTQKRVGKDGCLFTMHKFCTMTTNHGGSTISVAGESRITPLGTKLRHYKIDELPELWDVFRGKMSFVGPRPDVPGYADQLVGEDKEMLKLRPGITGPASLKYRDEENMIAEFVKKIKAEGDERSEEAIALWYNDNVIYPDKVIINCFYLKHYSFVKDMQMIFVTVFGKRMKYGGDII